MKLYVAGKISGEVGYRVKFAQACTEVATLGHVAVNPCELHTNCDHPLDHSKESWQRIMKCDIRAMLDCDGVYALKDWQDSKGATIEVNLARALKMEVFYQGQYEPMLAQTELERRARPRSQLQQEA